MNTKITISALLAPLLVCALLVAPTHATRVDAALPRSTHLAPVTTAPVQAGPVTPIDFGAAAAGGAGWAVGSWVAGKLLTYVKGIGSDPAALSDSQIADILDSYATGSASGT